MIFIISFSISGASVELEVEIDKDTGNKTVFLKDTHQDQLLKWKKVLFEWKKTRDKNFLTEEQASKIFPQKIKPLEINSPHIIKYTLDITLLIHNEALKVVGLAPSIDGPNCHNISLVFSNILSTYREVDSEEFFHYLNSGLIFKPIDPSNLTCGDIGCFSSNNFLIPPQHRLLHSFIYVGEDIIFEKQGYETSFPWTLTTIAENKKTYSDCGLSYYRPIKKCYLDKLEEHREELRQTISFEFLLNWEKMLSGFECNMLMPSLFEKYHTLSDRQTRYELLCIEFNKLVRNIENESEVNEAIITYERSKRGKCSEIIDFMYESLCLKLPNIGNQIFRIKVNTSHNTSK